VLPPRGVGLLQLTCRESGHIQVLILKNAKNKQPPTIIMPPQRNLWVINRRILLINSTLLLIMRPEFMVFILNIGKITNRACGNVGKSCRFLAGLFQAAEGSRAFCGFPQLRHFHQARIPLEPNSPLAGESAFYTHRFR